MLLINLLFCLIFNFALFSFELKTQAKAVVLIDEKTGKILFEKNAHQLLNPASTTKVATTCYALKLLKENQLNQLIEAQMDAIQIVTKGFKKKQNYMCKPYLLEPDGTSLDIKAQEKLPIKTLLYGIMLASANDAANVLAYYLGGNSIHRFVSHLNEYIQSLGCKKTHFANPHGLHHPAHQTTAYELAIIAREAMKNPFFREIVKTQTQVRPKTNKSEEKLFSQTNRLMKEGDFFYSQATGIKTGYTEDAGYCLVASAQNSERSLIAVVLGSPTAAERYSDVIELFNQAFEEEKKIQKIYDAKDAKFKLKSRKAETEVELQLEKDVLVHYYPSTKPTFSSQVRFENVDPPYNTHQKLGEVIVQIDGEDFGVYSLYAAQTVNLRLDLAILKFIKMHFMAVIFGFFGLNYGVYLLVKYRKQLIGLVVIQKLRS